MRVLIESLIVGLVFAVPGAQGSNQSEPFMLTNGCINCHGFEGQRPPGIIPSLAGLPEAYLYKTMTAYRNGTLKGTIMNRMMQAYDDQTLRQFALYYSRLPSGSLSSDSKDAPCR